MFPGEGDPGSISSGKEEGESAVSAAEPQTAGRLYEPRGKDGGLDPKQVLESWFNYAKAEGHVRVGSHRQGSSDLEQIGIIEAETGSLLEFCRRFVVGHGAWMEALTATTAPTTEGHEHRVFMRPESGRVVKVTWPGKYGRWEHSPSQYLRRWVLTNELAPDLDVRFHDFVSDKAGQCSFVTSMVLVPGKHPTSKQADEYLRRLKFERYNDERSTTLDYWNPATGLILCDCHPRNWIRVSKGELAPIDIVPEMLLSAGRLRASLPD